MSDLDICKRLKEAGFPQGKSASWFCPLCGHRPHECTHNIGHSFATSEKHSAWVWSLISRPSVEELLDALGERFLKLVRDGENDWWALPVYRHTDERLEPQQGDTAWHALAELFIDVSEGK